jgi:hypothetical protein
MNFPIYDFFSLKVIGLTNFGLGLKVYWRKLGLWRKGRWTDWENHPCLDTEAPMTEPLEVKRQGAVGTPGIPGLGPQSHHLLILGSCIHPLTSPCSSFLI